MSLNLNYESYGSGKALIILHGLFGCARNWRSMARQLAAHFEVYCVDLRNHGSSAHADSMTYSEMAADLQQFLQQQALQKVSIIGHSMGGKTAMSFALEHSDMVEKLLVLDIAPVPYNNEFNTILDAMLELDLQTLSSRNEANESLAASISESELRLFLLQNLLRDGAGFRWRLNLPAIKSSLADISAFPLAGGTLQFRGPCRFLAGALSDYIQPAHQPDIEPLFPAADIVTIDAAAHWLHADQPQAVFEEISHFLLATS